MNTRLFTLTIAAQAYAQENGAVEFDLRYDGPPTVAQQLAGPFVIAVTLVIFTTASRYVLTRWGCKIPWRRAIYWWPAFLTLWSGLQLWSGSESGLSEITFIGLLIASTPGILIAAPFFGLLDLLGPPPDALRVPMILAVLFASHHVAVRLLAHWSDRLQAKGAIHSLSIK